MQMKVSPSAGCNKVYTKDLQKFFSHLHRHHIFIYLKMLQIVNKQFRSLLSDKYEYNVVSLCAFTGNTEGKQNYEYIYKKK